MNAEVFQAIRTPIGKLIGRDAVHLDHVQCEVWPLQLTLTGSFNGGGAVFYDYALTFFEIQAFQTIELDYAEGIYFHSHRSSFDQVLNSNWLSRLRAVDEKSSVPQTIIARCKHYRLWTYDYVFDVICSHYELEVQLDNPHK